MCWSARPHHDETTSPVDSWQTLWFNPQNKHPWLCTFGKRSRMPELNSPWILLFCSRGRDTETQHWLLYVELGLFFFFFLTPAAWTPSAPVTNLFSGLWLWQQTLPAGTWSVYREGCLQFWKVCRVFWYVCWWEIVSSGPWVDQLLWENVLAKADTQKVRN